METNHSIALTERGIILAEDLPSEPRLITYFYSGDYSKAKKDYEAAIQQALDTSPVFKDQGLAESLFGVLLPFTDTQTGGQKWKPEKNKFYPIDLSGWEIELDHDCHFTEPLHTIESCDKTFWELTKKPEPAKEIDNWHGGLSPHELETLGKSSVESTEGETQEQLLAELIDIEFVHGRKEVLECFTISRKQ